MAEPVRLIYASVYPLLDRMSLSNDDWLAMLDDITSMEVGKTIERAPQKMTQDHRVKIVAEVDATQAREGFQAIKDGARDMAASVDGAGKSAGSAVKRIGDDATDSAQKADAAQRSILSSIRRTTSELQRWLLPTCWAAMPQVLRTGGLCSQARCRSGFPAPSACGVA